MVLVVGMLCVPVLTAAAHGAGRSAERRCGTVSTVTEGVSAQEKVLARGVSCRFARDLVRRSNSGRALPRPWRCLGSGEGVVCLPSTKSRTTSQARRGERRYVIGDLTR